MIDLSDRAAQPMQSRDGSTVLVYNGEIYNFASLRADLEKRGHSFSSTGDTEVLLRLYEELGDACLAELNGMFSFVLWDGKRRRALAARDRFGQKPLFYAETRHAVCLASEIKPLLRVPGISRDVSLPAVDNYLTGNWVPSPHTFFRGIHRVHPGEAIVVEEGRIRSRSRFSLPRGAVIESTESAALEDVSSLFQASVERQLVSDVPVGLFLSGGIDSTLVLSRMAPRLPGGFDAFTVAFSERERSELPYAEKAASRVGARLHSITLGPADFASPEVLVRMFNEPFADVAALGVAKLAREAKKLITVALTGDGGDELFGGYESHVVARYLDAAHSGNAVGQGMARFAELLPDSIGYRSGVRALKRFLGYCGDDFRRAVSDLRASLGPSERERLLLPGFLAELGDSDPYRQLLPEDPTDIRSFFDAIADPVMGDLFLHKTDITAMASGLECRSPFLDVPLSELARRLPIRHLVHGASGKHLLRRLLARDVDPQLARRRKTGFSPPIDLWLRGELGYLLDEWLSGPNQLIYQWVSREDVARRIHEHRAGVSNQKRPLWALILLEIWLRERHQL